MGQTVGVCEPQEAKDHELTTQRASRPPSPGQDVHELSDPKSARSHRLVAARRKVPESPPPSTEVDSSRSSFCSDQPPWKDGEKPEWVEDLLTQHYYKLEAQISMLARKVEEITHYEKLEAKSDRLTRQVAELTEATSIHTKLVEEVNTQTCNLNIKLAKEVTERIDSDSKLEAKIHATFETGTLDYQSQQKMLKNMRTAFDGDVKVLLNELTSDFIEKRSQDLSYHGDILERVKGHVAEMELHSKQFSKLVTQTREHDLAHIEKLIAQQAISSGRFAMSACTATEAERKLLEKSLEQRMKEVNEECAAKQDEEHFKELQAKSSSKSSGIDPSRSGTSQLTPSTSSGALLSKASSLMQGGDPLRDLTEFKHAEATERRPGAMASASLTGLRLNIFSR